ncbi:MAG: glycosyltransferase [Ardenticatenaceae bacterium]|nr:glycosyltransferase [Ardenticatenaceae bacterium]
MTIQYSIIIPAYNARHTLGNCLTALHQQTISHEQYEIIVIDDGSNDGTGQLATEMGATVLYQSKNGGQAAARNVGIRQAQGDIICFTDADCTPQPDWLEQITAPLRDDATISATKGVYCTRQPQLTARFVQAEYEDKYDKLREFPRISFVDTYSAAYRRAVLLEVGGFDERFPVAEDRELSYRVAAAGYEMVFQPEALVCHLHAHTVRTYFWKKVLNGYWAGQAVNFFPERQKEDSYTPQIMKLQVGLMGLMLGTAVLSLLFPPFLFLLGLSLGGFLATTLPFVQKVWPKDTAVALASPFYLAVRALALGIGYAWRIARPISPTTTNL